jgi:hypothetical protein
MARVGRVHTTVNSLSIYTMRSRGPDDVPAFIGRA